MQPLALGSLLALCCTASCDQPVDDISPGGETSDNGDQPGSARDKADLLLQKVAETEYDHLPFLPPASLVKLSSPEFCAASFNHESDELPPDRAGEKAIHTYGTVAEVSFQITDETPYTGLLASGTRSIGLARMSLAQLTPVPFVPGMALKLFVDGKSSRNLLAMWTLDGQRANQNFFEHDFSNLLPRPKGPVGKLIVRFFTASVDHIDGQLEGAGSLPLQHLANVNPDGSAVAAPRAPREMIFRPAIQMGEFDFRDFRVKLAELEPGTTLYDVFVKDVADGPEQHLGVLVLENGFVASRFGDQNLFFQHAALK